MTRAFVMTERGRGPRIGILVPCRAGALPERRRDARNAAAYIHALALAGARVVEARPEGDTRLDELGALLFIGGGDIDPRRYGQARHPSVSRVDEARDEFEIDLAREALARGIPVMGICRGGQVLGVAAGGGLLQDIPSQHLDALVHTTEPGRRVTRHWVCIEPGSRLRAILGADRVRVNSYHHQANGKMGVQMRAVAWSEDGVTEAIEGTGPGFVLGVQWHPERMPRSPRQRRLFAALAAAAGWRPCGPSLTPQSFGCQGNTGSEAPL